MPSSSAMSPAAPASPDVEIHPAEILVVANDYDEQAIMQSGSDYDRQDGDVRGREDGAEDAETSRNSVNVSFKAIPVTEENVSALSCSLRTRHVHDERGTEDESDMSSEEEEDMERKPLRSAGQEVLDRTSTMGEMMIQKMQTNPDQLVVLVLTSSYQSFMRSDMTRYDLLTECRRMLPQRQEALGASLQLRDLRALQAGSESALLVRGGAIVLSCSPLNAVVTSQQAFVVVPDGADDLLEPLLHRVQKLRGTEDSCGMIDFEFVALEALLLTLYEHHRRIVSKHAEVAQEMLHGIRSHLSNELLNRILLLKRKLSSEYEAVRGAQMALEETQDDKDALLLMYLTHHRKEEDLYKTNTLDTTQAEVLLDTYALEFQGLANELNMLEKEIDATEDYLKFKLDKARNRLIRLDVFFGIIGACLAVNSAITGFFGMNLPNRQYADGTVLPGQDFQPPTGGTNYLGPYEGGPSWTFIEVTVISSIGSAALLFGTCFFLSCCGLLRT
uniref:Magnesium transporter n=1 Tax=Guillardia theta TaxID=55529 RepID=A0A7S4KTB7_GUITH|mmetsp:Transcript_30759/g.98941  ORF Transcript_30759/g.98941 Transcript_30759/m.98941 type:complete len:502 (+) Transcript_30759:139-1644(+)